MQRNNPDAETPRDDGAEPGRRQYDVSRENEAPRLDVLVVDDSAADRALMRMAFKRSGAPVNLHVCDSGADAVDFVAARGRFAGAPRPHACLVDLKMPDVSGIDVLDAIKSEPETRGNQVVMISSSDRRRDICDSYDRHANGYVCKPLKSADLVDVVRSLSHVWTKIFKLAEV